MNLVAVLCAAIAGLFAILVLVAHSAIDPWWAILLLAVAVLVLAVHGLGWIKA
jgi:hypothetical protein